MKRITILALVLAGVLLAAGAAQARLPRPARELRAAQLAHHQLPAAAQLRLAAQTIHYATSTLRFLRAHPRAGTYRGRAVIAHNHQWLLRFGALQQREAKARLVPPHLAAWACIHRYEGDWDDSGAPYYGGLQMDWGFMRAYGGELLARKGTADHWSPLEQMWVAERALRAGRGFYPWPNTARVCGLI